MKLGSLFDGIGGWLLAAEHAGITPVWASEIEKFPCAVTAHHFPDVKQLGDITKIDGGAIEPVDIITAGSPCQDLSIAGKREGLEGARSGLFRRAVDVVRQMRRATDGRYPRWFVWENVPGAFSSNNGLDFRAVLEEIGETEIPMPKNGRWANAGLAELPKCEIAWRVLDAQYWGVPQRRKRIFLVADFAAEGRCAGEVLFEQEGLRGNPSESGETREGTAATIKSGTGIAVYNAYQHHGYREGKTVGTLTTGINRIRGDTPLALEKVYPINLQIATRHQSLGERTGLGIGADGDNAYTLEANHSHGVAIIRERAGKPGGGKGPLVSWDKSLTLAANANDQVLVECYDISHRSDVIRPQTDGKTPCITARYGTGGNNVPIVHCYDMTHANHVITETKGDKCHTLNARMGTGGNQVPIVHCVSGNTIDREPQNDGNGAGVQENVSYTLNTMDRHAVSTYQFQAFGQFRESGKASTIRSRDCKDATDLIVWSDRDATEGNKVLCLLWEAYGEKAVSEWCSAIMERIQQEEVLRQGVHEESVSIETPQGAKLDDDSLPCAEFVAGWMLRDLRERKERGCTPQGRKPSQQQPRKPNESVQELPHQTSSSAKEMCDLWRQAKGAWLLLQALAAFQKIRQPAYIKCWRQTKTVRRLTPLEAERLQGLPDNYTLIDDKSCSDSARYKAIGNGMAQPCADYVLRRIKAVAERD